MRLLLGLGGLELGLIAELSLYEVRKSVNDGGAGATSGVLLRR
jgi:hypothetical protein